MHDAPDPNDGDPIRKGLDPDTEHEELDYISGPLGNKLAEPANSPTPSPP